MRASCDRPLEQPSPPLPKSTRAQLLAALKKDMHTTLLLPFALPAREGGTLRQRLEDDRDPRGQSEVHTGGVTPRRDACRSSRAAAVVR